MVDWRRTGHGCEIDHLAGESTGGPPSVLLQSCQIPHRVLGKSTSSPWSPQGLHKEGRLSVRYSRDAALGLSADGFAPFNRCKLTAWPLILINYNLPPEVRSHVNNIFSLGIIPGKPVDSDSFLWPVVQELLRLSIGVRVFDVLDSLLFALCAFLILVFGDIPAMAMIMWMKGHNGFSPCHMCEIHGLRQPNSRVTAHYVPLDRSCHPDV